MFDAGFPFNRWVIMPIRIRLSRVLGVLILDFGFSIVFPFGFGIEKRVWIRESRV